MKIMIGVSFVSSLLVVVLGVAVWMSIQQMPCPPGVGEPTKYKLVASIHSAVLGMAPYFSENDNAFVINTYSSLQRLMAKGGDSVVSIKMEQFDDVTVRIYEPSGDVSGRPGVMFYHGGGFIMHTPEGYDGLCVRLARDLHAVVVSVEYKKAPDFMVPTAFEDSKRATLHFFENSDSWNVDKSKIGAVGDGSGANLALSLALLLRDSGSSPQFAFLGLLSPAVQGLDFTLPSYDQMEEYNHDLSTRGSVVTAMTSYYGVPEFAYEAIKNNHLSKKTYIEFMHHVNKTYIGYEKYHSEMYREDPLSDALELDLTDPYNMPLMADNFVDLPPAYIMTIEWEGSRDEGIILANRMAQDGKVVHRHSVLGWNGMMRFVDHTLLDVQEAGDMTDKLTEFATEYV